MSNNLNQSMLLVDADSVNSAGIKVALKRLELEIIIAGATEEVSELENAFRQRLEECAVLLVMLQM